MRLGRQPNPIKMITAQEDSTWIEPPPNFMGDIIGLQPTRIVQKKINWPDTRLRENHLKACTYKVTNGSVKLIYTEARRENESPIDLRTGIVSINVGFYKVDDITLAFFRKKTHWKEPETNHEIQLPRMATR